MYNNEYKENFKTYNIFKTLLLLIKSFPICFSHTIITYVNISHNERDVL